MVVDRALAYLPERRYPDAAAARLKRSLRDAFEIPDDLALVLGNGSDEIIQMIGLALTGADRTVLAPAPTFVMYEMIARFVGAEFVSVPLREDFTLDRGAEHSQKISDILETLHDEAQGT